MKEGKVQIIGKTRGGKRETGDDTVTKFLMLHAYRIYVFNSFFFD